MALAIVARYLFRLIPCRGDTEKYFPFELVKSTVPGIERKNVRLAAATREELEYWMKGIEVILKRLGTNVCILFFLAKQSSHS